MVRHLRAIGTGMKHLFSNRLTCPYPDARQMVNERYRGMIRLDVDKCTSCMLCVRACPANAMERKTVKVVKEMRRVEKVVPALDYARCIFCGYCVDICPLMALAHTSLHDAAYFDYEENQFPPEKLINGGRDPYYVPKGVVAVRIHEKRGLTYGKPEKPKVDAVKEVKPTPKPMPKPAPEEKAETAPKETAEIEPKEEVPTGPKEEVKT